MYLKMSYKILLFYILIYILFVITKKNYGIVFIIFIDLIYLCFSVCTQTSNSKSM